MKINLSYYLKITTLLLFPILISNHALAFQKQKPDTINIDLSESEYTLSDYNDSVQSISTIILYHPAKPFEGDYFYEVFINDTVVYDAVWGTADTIKVPSQIPMTLKAKSLAEDYLHFTPKRGKIYFFRCSLRKGAIRGKPLLESIEPGVAEKELMKIK